MVITSGWQLEGIWWNFWECCLEPSLPPLPPLPPRCEKLLLTPLLLLKVLSRPPNLLDLPPPALPELLPRWASILMKVWEGAFYKSWKVPFDPLLHVGGSKVSKTQTTRTEKEPPYRPSSPPEVRIWQFVPPRHHYPRPKTTSTDSYTHCIIITWTDNSRY